MYAESNAAEEAETARSVRDERRGADMLAVVVTGGGVARKKYVRREGRDDGRCYGDAHGLVDDGKQINAR